MIGVVSWTKRVVLPLEAAVDIWERLGWRE